MTAQNPAAGKPVDAHSLTNVPRLVTAYFASRPNPGDPAQRISFGTSGHRGSSLKNSFNENHILATTQAICDYRAKARVTGPLFVGIDTHTRSPSLRWQAPLRCSRPMASIS
jgi:phosphoglucomutase